MKPSCENCLLFKQAFKNVRIEQSKDGTFPIAILEGLPRNGDGSVNYEDLVFAINARKAMGVGNG